MSPTIQRESSAATEELAHFAIVAEPPPEALKVARCKLATTVSLSVGGVRSPATRSVLSALLLLGTPPQASILGRSERLAAPLAALVNGFAAGTYRARRAGCMGVEATVVPAALAVAEWRGVGGQDLARSVSVGLEIGVRFSNSFSGDLSSQGWDVAAISGGLGAVAATGSLLELGQKRMQRAIGLAATQSAGVEGGYETMQPFHFGKSAANAVEAALLVNRGLTAPLSGVEGRRGLFSVLDPRGDPDALLNGLSEEWISAHAEDGDELGVTTDEQVSAEAQDIARGTLSPDRAAELVEACLDSVAPVTRLVNLARP